MPNLDLNGLSILIVDDQASNIMLLKNMLERAGYSNLHSTTDARTVQEWIAHAQPDLVVLDLHMPVRDGFAVMDDIRAMQQPGEYLPILVITADVMQETKRRALALGAKDFLSKPFDQTEVLLRIHNLLEIRSFDLWLRAHNQHLGELVQQRTREIESAHSNTLERLALAAEYRDDTTGDHTRRVAQLSKALASALELPSDRVELIERAAPLHDVGKIGIPDQILLKPGRLTSEEFAQMQSHTTIGAKLLSGTADPLLQIAEEIVLSHHERWDGTGYPDGLAGYDIPIAGRIVAVADVYDALTHDRPYKTAWTATAALEEIGVQAGRQFDPQIVEAFVQLWEQEDHWVWEWWPRSIA